MTIRAFRKQVYYLRDLPLHPSQEEVATEEDYQAMKPYIEIAEKTKADAMKLFEQEMEK